MNAPAPDGLPLPFAQILAPLLNAQPEFRDVLRFVFSGKNEFRFLRDLRVPPAITSHCNVVRESGFVVPGERFGLAHDIPLIPLVRQAVDETVDSFRGYYPQIDRYLPHIPLAAYGSMGLSVRRLGSIDWDYVRDLDFRVFLPPQIGHTSGFKSALERRLDSILRHAGLKPVFGGKNEEGQPQVQLQETGTGAIHGFHFYLLKLAPGFIRANIHEGGGYSLYHAYFPESAIDAYLAEGLLWQDLLERETETYASMFNRVGYYLFTNDVESRRAMRQRGWYPHKAFKWYATLARLRADTILEAELLAHYDNFAASKADPQYLVRDTYWAQLNPERAESRLLERDIARAFSREYSLGRCPDGDALIDRRVQDSPDAPLILEPLDEEWADAALSILNAASDALPFLTTQLANLAHLAATRRLRFADDLDVPTTLLFPDGEPGIALPSGWALVFTNGYVRLAAQSAQSYEPAFDETNVKQALQTLLAARLAQAASFKKGSGN